MWLKMLAGEVKNRIWLCSGCVLAVFFFLVREIVMGTLVESNNILIGIILMI